MSSRSRIIVLAVAALVSALICLPASAQAEFGVQGLSTTAKNFDGTLASQAGSHPYEYTVDFAMNLDDKKRPEGKLRNAVVDLAPGVFGYPLAIPRCPRADFVRAATSRCSASTQVGVVRVKTTGSPAVLGLYNLVPPPGVPARFGFRIASFTSFQDATLRGGDYGVTIVDETIPTAIDIQSVTETVWGTPADPRHDGERFCTDLTGNPPGCSSDAPMLPFFSLPSQCETPLETSIRVESLEAPGVLTEPLSAFSLNAAGNPAPLNGCNAVPFAPKIAASPSSRLAENATGIDFELRLPNAGHFSPNGVAEAEPEKVEVTLPEGVTVNPSAAEGLGVCSPAGYANETLNSKPGQGCPESSKIGSLIAHTPLLDEPVEGSLYLAKPFDNPSNSLLALYIVARATERGILIKQAGKVAPDPKTGQLVTTFDKLPPLPYSDFTLHFREGARAPLVTPSACGSYETVAKLTPFSAPTQPVTAKSSFKIEGGVNGGACPPAGAAPFKPEFTAGSVNNNAKSYSPFYMRLQRHDGEQDMTRFSSILPPGVLGKLAGVDKCPDSAVAVAKSKTGLDEIANPSCPANSQIGRILAGAGVGSVLTYAGGKVYLGGPYNGAPLSAIVITPAVAGPFDVGTVVVRVGLNLDPVTAEVEVDGAASDPIPHILAGIPLKVRDLRVYADRESFIINPTSCEPSSARATLFGGWLDVFSSTDDVPVSLEDRFQAANCTALNYKPSLTLNLKGGTKRGGHPGLLATFKPKPAEANTKGIVVRLPRSAFLDQAHIRTICTRVQFAADACPKGAQYGFVKAWTPLLDEPLTGPVWLRSSNHKLPDMVFDLHGIVDVEVSTRIDSFRGGIRASIESAPDAPLTKVQLRMQGGKKGLIVNSRNLCGALSRANVELAGHNGKLADSNPVMRADGCGGKRKGKRGKR